MTSRILLLLLTLLISGAAFADAVTYTYDDAGRLTSAAYPNGTVIAYTYDAAGNLTSRNVTGGAGSSTQKPQPGGKAASKTKRAPASKSGSAETKTEPAKH